MAPRRPETSTAPCGRAAAGPALWSAGGHRRRPPAEIAELGKRPEVAARLLARPGHEELVRQRPVLVHADDVAGPRLDRFQVPPSCWYAIVHTGAVRFLPLPLWTVISGRVAAGGSTVSAAGGPDESSSVRPEAVKTSMSWPADWNRSFGIRASSFDRIVSIERGSAGSSRGPA